ncbi:hypothetical protein GCM10010378_56300 [Streptomyces viridochromogenes]
MQYKETGDEKKQRDWDPERLRLVRIQRFGQQVEPDYPQHQARCEAEHEMSSVTHMLCDPAPEQGGGSGTGCYQYGSGHHDLPSQMEAECHGSVAVPAQGAFPPAPRGCLADQADRQDTP